MKVTIKQAADGEPFIVIPKVILRRLGWREDERLVQEVTDQQSVRIRKASDHEG